MATKIFCDKCNKEIEENKFIFSYTIEEQVITAHWYLVEGKREYCEACIREILNGMDRLILGGIGRDRIKR